MIYHHIDHQTHASLEYQRFRQEHQQSLTKVLQTLEIPQEHSQYTASEGSLAIEWTVRLVAYSERRSIFIQ